MRFLPQKILAYLSTRLACRRGQTLVEYSLILAIIGIVFIAVFSMLSKQIIIIFSAITTLLDSAQSSTF
jgi:Flp pilus assembly pilin Flp